MKTPGSTNRRTHPAFTAPPLPGCEQRDNCSALPYKCGLGQMWKPDLLPNISFNFKDVMCQNVCTRHGLQRGGWATRGHQEITATTH